MGTQSIDEDVEKASESSVASKWKTGAGLGVGEGLVEAGALALFSPRHLSSF